MGFTHWKEEFVGKEGIDVAPEALPIETVIFLSRSIARYKDNVLTYNEQQDFVELLKFWIGQILRGQNLQRLRAFEKDYDSLMLPIMSELEFLLNHQLITRQIRYPTYIVLFRDLFNDSRMDVERWELPPSFTSLNNETIRNPKLRSR